MASFLDIFRQYLPTWNEVRNKPSTFDAAAHAASHQNGGADVISLAGLAIDDHAAAHQNSGTDEISVASLSGTLADEQDAGAIKGVIVDDTAIGDQKVLAFDTVSGNIIYITPAPSGAAIASIQSGLITVEAETSETATISEVDLTQSVCLWLGANGNAIAPNLRDTTVELTDSTTVTARKQGASDYEYVSFTVLEFTGLTSVQQLTLTIAAGQNAGNQAITTVDLSKAALFYGGFRSDDARVGNNEQHNFCHIEFTSATNVYGKRLSVYTEALYINFTVVEFP